MRLFPLLKLWSPRRSCEMSTAVRACDSAAAYSPLTSDLALKRFSAGRLGPGRQALRRRFLKMRRRPRGVRPAGAATLARPLGPGDGTYFPERLRHFGILVSLLPALDGEREGVRNPRRPAPLLHVRPQKSLLKMHFLVIKIQLYCAPPNAQRHFLARF